MYLFTQNYSQALELLEIRNNKTQKMKFSFKDFFSECDQICRKLQIWSQLLKKSLMENFIFVQCNGQIWEIQTGHFWISRWCYSLQLIKCQSFHQIETSQLICRANRLTDFYMTATLALNELNSGWSKVL